MDLNLGDTQLIISTAKARGVLRNQLAYILATAYHETAHTMKPVKEAYWVKDAETWRKDHLRYYPWYGRGYVQLTWDYNYKKASAKIGVDLTKDPDLAMIPENAAKILIIGMMEGWFSGKALPTYVDLQHSDYIGARHVVNGTDKAEEISGYAKVYDDALKAIGYGEDTTTAEIKPVIVPPSTPVGPTPTLLDLILKLLGLK